MNHPRRQNAFTVILLMSLFVPLGCLGETPIGPIRATMSAPDLQYLPPEKIRTAMWVLAAEIQHLERLMTDPTQEEHGAMQVVVAGTLQRMKIAARTLDKPGRATQHPVINQNLGNFLSRIERAQRAVDRDPPNYFPASSLAGSCFLCHGGKTVTAMWPPLRANPRG